MGKTMNKIEQMGAGALQDRQKPTNKRKPQASQQGQSHSGANTAQQGDSAQPQDQMQSTQFTDWASI